MEKTFKCIKVKPYLITIYTTVAASKSTRTPAILGIETLGKFKNLILRR